MPIESPYITWYLMSTVFSVGISIYKTFIVKMSVTVDIWHGPRQSVSMPIKRPYYMTCYLMPIVMFILSITISKILIVEMWMTLTLGMGEGQM